MAIRTFTKADNQLHLGKYWTVNELWLDDKQSKIIMDDNLVDTLDVYTDFFGCKPRFPTRHSLYCPSGLNRTNAYHFKGMAADIYIPGVTPLELAQFAEIIGVNGIGLNKDWDTEGKYVHIDTRLTSPCYWLFPSVNKHKSIKISTTYRYGHRSPLIARIQRVLGITADGMYGPLTISAISKLQASHGLENNGRLDKPTLFAMGMI